MCGIIGIFHREDAFNLVSQGLNLMINRGKDGYGVGSPGSVVHSKVLAEMMDNKADCLIGHCLHSIVGTVLQPVEYNGSVLAANCEIYNWVELVQEYELSALNDAEMILQLIEKIGFDEALSKFDGSFAFAYWKKNSDQVVLVRDRVGIKPLWYSRDNFAFASERKVLIGLGYSGIEELNPRKILYYGIRNKKITFGEQEFFLPKKELTKSHQEIKDDLKEILKEAVRKRVPDKKIGVLFSGGIDSTFIAFMLKELGVPFTCYTAALEEEGLKEAKDLTASKKIAEELGFDLKIVKIGMKEVPDYLKKLVPLIEDSNVIKVGVALPFFLACEAAHKDGVKVMMSGLGSEEVFAGYERHKNALDINKECLAGLFKMYERDLYRDDVVTMFNSVELRLPLLDNKLIDYALGIPSKYKIVKDIAEGDVSGIGTNGNGDGGYQVKVIFREVAKEMGLPIDFANRKKVAAQYGSNFDKAIAKLSKKEGKLKSEYLDQFLDRKIMKVAVLFSGGKDSNYAAWTMKRQNYELACLVSLESENKFSYMYQALDISFTELQAKALGIPLIVEKTKGEKEAELEDLRRALVRAKNEYGVEGVVTGALYSTYQRDRIENICDDLGLKKFSPLWHIDQELEMRNLIKEGFEVILASVAAEGFDKSWLGRKLTDADVDKLVELNNKIGLNVAGEGGEFESLVLNSPMFKERIVIDDMDIVETGECSGHIVIKGAHLDAKHK